MKIQGETIQTIVQLIVRYSHSGTWSVVNSSL